MGKIELTAYEEQQLRGQEYLIRPLPGANGANGALYHNPITGQEFENMPTDPRALELYLKVKGWRLGPAPAELKEAWLAGEAERKAADDQMVERYKRTQPLSAEEIPGFNEAVAAATEKAVTQVLKSLGIEPPSEQTVGTPTETDTKLLVSDVLPGESSE